MEMKYTVVCGEFSKDQNEKAIKYIKLNKSSPRKIEKGFKQIAMTILPASFEDIESPAISQSVPFDFIARKNNELALIELKGRENSFNYSSMVQYSRLKQVVERLKRDRVKHSIFMLQINMDFGIYQILSKGFYDFIFKCDLKGGRDQSIEPSMKLIDEYRHKYML